MSLGEYWFSCLLFLHHHFCTWAEMVFLLILDLLPADPVLTLPSLLCIVRSWPWQASFLPRLLGQQVLAGLGSWGTWQEMGGQKGGGAGLAPHSLCLGNWKTSGPWKHLICCFRQSARLVFSFLQVTPALDTGSKTFFPFSCSLEVVVAFCSQANLWFSCVEPLSFRPWPVHCIKLPRF